MAYQFHFQPYQRPFKTPLKTSHGVWKIREGLIIQLQDETGNLTEAEIAPLSWFGSETVEEALHFCQQLPPIITSEMILEIPDHLPACQFGFGSAWERLNLPIHVPQKRKFVENLSPLSFSSLLPSGEVVLKAWEKLWIQGYRTFKWKITSNFQQELTIFERLIQQLESKKESFFLRLDGNGGLNDDQAEKWLQVADSFSPLIEFIEQPLSIHKFDKMVELSQCYSTPIALDESVANLRKIQECYHQGWRGLFVIKPSILGFPFTFRQFWQNTPIDGVFSSVFETPIGEEIALKFALELRTNSRALGFGVTHWFNPK